MARERISQHKIDEMKQQLSDMKTLIERSYNKSVDAGTQTDPECPVSNVCYPSCSPQIGTPSSYTCRYITTAPETPREWGGIVTGMSWTD
jgi:hypothetical protein